MRGFLLFVVFGIFVVRLEGLPPGGQGVQYERKVPTDNALKFMKQYGYLVDDNGQSEAIYSEENLSAIIRKLQKFGAIEETGIIDNTTLKLMSSPRCGVPDILTDKQSKRRKRFTTVSRWNKRHITYYISNWSSRLGEEIVAKNIQKALDVWGGYGRLTFSRSYTPEADIIVAFSRGYHGDNYPFDGPGLVLAHAFFPGNSNTYNTDGDIHFDDDESWVDLTDQERQEGVEGTDFFTVALHELGHSLGLSHSTVPTSVMFPYYKGWDEDSNNLLDYDDILGMYNLYVQQRLDNEDVPEYNPPTEPSTTSTTTTSTYTSEREPTTEPTRRRYSPFGPRRKPPHRHNHNHPHFPHKIHPTNSPRDEDRTILYEGDDESIEVHKKHDPYNPGLANNSPSMPYICQGHFDAVATLRGELYFFKDEYLWRLKTQGVIFPGYPTTIRQMFPGLPKSVKKIDAAYQKPNGNIVLFTGDQIWISDGFEFVENSPQPLTYYGLPDYLDSIDAVQTWAKNGKTYIYKNDRFWRYNESSGLMDENYPMGMERWRGVPSNLDAATTWKGITYFFKGYLYWTFDNNFIKPIDNLPMPAASVWLGCKEDPYLIERLYGA